MSDTPMPWEIPGAPQPGGNPTRPSTTFTTQDPIAVAAEAQAEDYIKIDNGIHFDAVTFAIGLNDYKRAVHQCAAEHGWWEDGDERNIGEMMMLMVTELAEGYEAYREGDNPQEIRYEYKTDTGPQVLYAPQFVYGDGTVELGKPVGVASELADTIIRILDYCEKKRIPITEALIRKHKYNLTRPYRHGGKLA